ncbi:MAG: sulfur carrier protein ThiS [Planctomycetota bacterium]
MNITLNGQEKSVEPGTKIGSLADSVVSDRSRIAVEQNRVIVPRDDYDSVDVADGDVIEIVTLVGGG